jgi:hypothetical protein
MSLVRKMLWLTPCHESIQSCPHKSEYTYHDIVNDDEVDMGQNAYPGLEAVAAVRRNTRHPTLSLELRLAAQRLWRNLQLEYQIISFLEAL